MKNTQNFCGGLGKLLQRDIAAWTASLLVASMLLPATAQAASTWNPTLLVNTESFQTVDEGDGTTSIEIRFGQTLNEKIFYDRTNNRFVFSRSLKVSGTLTTTGSAIINTGNTSATADTGVALEVLGTMSGQNLFITKSISGANIYAASQFSGAGLTSCTGSANKLTWNATTKQFSCESDETGAANTFGSGNTIMIGDSRYVNVSGDTMTGALQITSANGLTSSGSIFTRNNLTASGNLTINSDNGAIDSTLTFGNATVQGTVTYANATQRFNFNKEIHTTTNLTASGTITADGAIRTKSSIRAATSISGSTLTVDGNITIKGQTYVFPNGQGAAGSVLKNNGSNTLTWSTSLNNSSGGVMTLHPEYEGATYFQSGSTAVGSMTYSYDSTNAENFYRWTTTRSSLQDYWTSVRVQVPKGYSHFDTASGITLRLRTTSTNTANNYLTVRLLDTTGAAVAISNNSQLVSNVASTWATKTITGVTAGTYTAGGYITILLKTAALTANNMDLGSITLNWATTTP